MKTIRASISGFGAVGQGVVEVLLKKEKHLKNLGLDIRVVSISDSKGSEINTEGIDLSSALTRKREKGTVALDNTSSLEIIKSIDHDLVIETTSTDIETGGIGLQNMMSAFDNGRDVVTSNKGPIALKYNELIEASRKSGSKFRFEATVGGAMPIINLIKNVLAGNDVISVEGILNGTCNYILTRMMEENAPYEQMLAESQELGIAETDPSYDVDGIDSACKLVILANTVFGLCFTYRDVDVTGISKITPESLILAQNNGYVIKLIGEVKEDLIRVAPRLVPEDSPLAVGGTLNVASIQTDLSGTVTVTGRGAGSIETASAILSDIISIYKN
ncbi:MAG: homoserine dehydrogenase [Methanohalobium sp.]|uniref:homoserine dehydrogenase n=1 Tax=Methanohalobium sp. TaxID=2837493 RepID=UPI00397DB5A9